MTAVCWVRRILPGLTLLALVSGCGQGTDPLLPVSGRVKYKGNVLPGGTIVFTPDSSRGGRGEIAWGEVREDGSYSLRTGKNFGAPAGWYRVTIAAVASQTEPLPGRSFLQPLPLLPDKYRDPNLSQLACEIKGDRANTVDFDLTD